MTIAGFPSIVVHMSRTARTLTILALAFGALAGNAVRPVRDSVTVNAQG